MLRAARLWAAFALVLTLAGTAQAGILTLAWDPTGEPDVVGYWVSYGTQEGVYTNTVDVGNVSTAVLSGLEGGQLYYFTVQAYNGLFSSLPSNVVSGSTTNLPPLVATPGHQTSVEGTGVSLAVSASDPDGDLLIYTAENLPAGLTINSASGVIGGTPSYTAAGSYSVTVTASDVWLSASGTFTWTLADANGPPSLQHPGSYTNFVGDAVLLPLVASDPDGDPITYSAFGLPPGLSLNTATGLISGSPTARGTYVVTASVSDGAVSNSQNFAWTVPNRALTLQNPGPQITPEGTAVSLQILASDPDGDTLTYTAVLPPGLSVNSTTGLISGAPLYTIAGIPAFPISRAFIVGLVVTDGVQQKSVLLPTWTILNVNRAPTLTSPGDQAGAEGAAISLSLVASDPDGNPLTYSATGLPGGVAISPATGAITGTLSDTSAGTHTVTLSVTDGTLPADQTITWTVTTAPAVTTPADRTDAEGVVISLGVTASDPDGDTLTFSATGLPGGLAINAATGVISGTLSYTSAGSYTVTVSASDGTVTTTSANVSWMVTNTNRAPVVPIPNRTDAEGSIINVTLGASDPDGDPITAHTATGLPAGLSIHATTGVISGTLSYTGAGSHAVTVSASDGTATTTTPSFTWTVTNTNRAPSVTTPADRTDAEGAVISLAVTAIDPDGATLTYSAAGLPGGLSIHATSGLISGTLSYTSAGSYTITVSASDGTATMTSANVSWRVTNTNGAPEVTNPTNRTDAEGTTITIPVAASDPDHDPLTFSATGLPDGAAIDTTTGVISGTLSYASAGTHNVMVAVSDGSASTDHLFIWTVTNAVPAMSALADRTDVEGAAITLTVTASDADGNPLSYSASGLAGVSAWRIVGVNDVDGDGQSDLVWRQTQNGDVAMWLLDGTTVKQAPVVASGVPLVWKIVGTGDLDGDGKADLVWRHTQTGDVAAWLMDGATAKEVPPVAGAVPLAWQIVGTGDLDGDDKADLVWRSTQTGDVALWLMDGVTAKDGPVIATGVPLAWRIDSVGDLDGDGKADLVWRHTQTGDVAVWLMDGPTMRQGPIVSAGVPLVWQIVGVKDVDGDDKADLVWRHMPSGHVAVWLMNGVAVKRMPAVD